MRNYERLRTYSWADPTLLDADGQSSDDPNAPTTPITTHVLKEDANLVSSLLVNDKHAPVLDIDFPARLIPSSTPGHFHLYLDGIAITWEKYEALLRALADAKIIGPGYLKHSLARGQTVVRRPGVKKGQSVPPPMEPYEEPF